MRQNRTRAQAVADSEIPGGLDVFFKENYTASGDVVRFDTNDALGRMSQPLDGGIYTESGDADDSGMFHIAPSDDLGADPSIQLEFVVSNRGSTNGSGVFGDGNPDSCEGGSGTLISLVAEVAGVGYTTNEVVEGEQFVTEAICIPDNGILDDPVAGRYEILIPPNWLGGMRVGDTITFDVWAMGSNTKTRVTPIYRIEGVAIEFDGDSETGDETDDGGGGGDLPPVFGANFTVTNREWREEGDELVVEVTIEGGEGGAQSVPVTYYIDGSEFDSGTIAGQGVAEGNTDSDEKDIDLADIEPGEHLLEVEVGDTGISEVGTIMVEAQPTGNPADQLSIENCEAARFGSDATGSADIVNTNPDFSIQTDVRWLVNGSEAATIEGVLIEGGGTESVSREVPIPDAVGDYTIDIETVNEQFQ